MTEADVTVLNLPTDKLPLALKAKRRMPSLPGSPVLEMHSTVPRIKGCFTSADVPGLIYDVLFVSDESLEAHAGEWEKIVRVWFRIADFIKDSENRGEVLKIMSERVGVSPAEYEPMLEGAFLLGSEGNKKAFKVGEGLDSIYGSTKIADQFNVDIKNYTSPQDVNTYIYPDFTM